MARVVVVDGTGSPRAGIPVSDGLSTWLTDTGGAVEVPVPSGPFAQLSLPDGWDADAWFAPWAEEVRFVLHPVEQPVPFAFAQLTDLHLATGDEPVRLIHPDGMFGWDEAGELRSRPLTSAADVHHALEAILAGAEAAGFPPAAFAVATGDLTDHGTAEEFAVLAQVRAEAPVPVWVIPGNHDHYGHEHEPAEADAPEDSAGMGTMTTWRFERHVGPRWWSRTWGGLRVVAVDWFAWRAGGDGPRQEAWVTGDLATAAPGTPVLFLTHDHMATAFFERVAAAAPHVRLVGSLSGHWHTSRVVQVHGQLHVNTGNATFGSFDWSPAHGRLLRWDGERLEVRTVAVGGTHDPGATFRAAASPPEGPGVWARRLPGAVHLAAPVLAAAGAAALVVCAWGDDDRAEGGVVAHDAATGEQRWEVVLDAPVWATPAVDGDLVVAVTVNGRVVAIDAAGGSVRWTTRIGDPVALWVHATPLVDRLSGRVFAGEYRTFAALDLDDGSVVWRRSDFGKPENFIAPSAPALADGVLVVGFGMYQPNLYGLDPVDGATVWTRPEPPIRCPLTDVVGTDDGSGDAYVGRMGGRIDRFAGASGELRWKVALGAQFLRGRPVRLPGGDVVVATGLGTVHRLEAASGREVWRSDLEGQPPLAFGPYRRSGPAVACNPTLGTDGALWLPATDGQLHRIDAATGAAAAVARLPGPVTAAALALPDGDVVVATGDGGLHRVAAAAPAPARP